MRCLCNMRMEGCSYHHVHDPVLFQYVPTLFSASVKATANCESHRKSTRMPKFRHFQLWALSYSALLHNMAMQRKKDPWRHCKRTCSKPVEETLAFIQRQLPRSRSLDGLPGPCPRPFRRWFSLPSRIEIPRYHLPLAYWPRTRSL